MKKLWFAVLLIPVFLGCSKNNDPDYFREITYYFNGSMEGWQGSFADYPKADSAQYNFGFDLVKLPLPLDTNMTAVKITADNPDGDLFSYMWVPVTGFASNTSYDVTYIVHIATNISTGTAADIYVGVGGLDTIPTVSLDENNWYRSNFEVKIKDGIDNEVMKTVGKLGALPNTTAFTPISRSNYSDPMTLTSDRNGTIYLLVGWDSPYAGNITAYIKTVIVRFEYRE